MGENRGVSPSTITPLEYLDQLCEYALSIGMSYNDYWYGEAQMLLRYHNAEKLRQRKRNNELWLQGLYVYMAVGNLVPVLNPFSKEHRAKSYLKDPIPLTEEDRKEKEEKDYQRFKQQMFDLVKTNKV